MSPTSLLKKIGAILSSFFSKIQKQADLLKSVYPEFSRILVFFGKKTDLNKTEYDHLLVANLSKKRLPKLRQLKYIPQVLSKSEWWVVKIASLVFVLSLGALLVNLYFSFTKIVPAAGGVYTEGLVGAPKFINPLYSTLNDVDQDIVSLVYVGLVKIDKNQQLVPGLAESWQVSADQKEYTFVLRQDLRWQDGEPVTAEDVLFTIQAIQDPEFKSPLAGNFADVKIEVINERTIKFTLKESFSPFLESLTVGILPAHLWREVVPANALLADYNLRPIGAGPYRFKSLIKDKLGNIKVYSLERNKNYLPRAPYLKEINFKFYPDFKTAAEALKNHNIDGLSYLPKDLKKEVSTRKDLNFNMLSLPQYTAIFFNQKNNTALKDLKIRKALAYALNKQEIVDEALMGDGGVIEAPILQGFIGYHPKIAKYEYNFEKASELLDEAGWKLENKSGEQIKQEATNKEGNDNDNKPQLNSYEQVRKKGDKELKIILTTVNRAENFKAAQLIQKMWQAIGVKTELKIVETGQIQSEVIRKRDFEALLFGEIFGSDPDPYPFWHSSQTGEGGLNLANFVNKEADKVLEEARQISDPQKRHDKYVHFQNILNAQLPAIFLYTPKYLYPVSNRIQGNNVQIISIPADRFSNVEEWYVRTKRAFEVKK